MGKVLDIAAYGNLSVAVGCDRTIYVWGDCFDECITTPFPTKFSRIHDVFAYTKWKNMHKPLIVSTNVYNYAEEVFKILESLETEFDNPVRFVFFCILVFFRIRYHKTEYIHIFYVYIVTIKEYKNL